MDSPESSRDRKVRIYDYISGVPKIVATLTDPTDERSYGAYNALIYYTTIYNRINLQAIRVTEKNGDVKIVISTSHFSPNVSPITEFYEELEYTNNILDMQFNYYLTRLENSKSRTQQEVRKYGNNLLTKLYKDEKFNCACAFVYFYVNAVIFGSGLDSEEIRIFGIDPTYPEGEYTVKDITSDDIKKIERLAYIVDTKILSVES